MHGQQNIKFRPILVE